ncbi:RNA-directed DNA polymerase, eukaryota [Tanacetum coccineum]
MGVNSRSSFNTKEDQTQKISKSVFVTNFPDHFSARDLWNMCVTYGNVIDVFIPFKRSKSGKRFAFARFIRVANLERLIENLCTIWNGRLLLHANVARFQMVPINNASQPKNNDSQPHKNHVDSVKNLGAVKVSFADVLNSGRIYPSKIDVTSPTIVLDDACLMERDFSSSLMGKIKDINAMSNLYLILANEDFDNVKITHLGGMWVLLEMDSIIVKDKILKHVGVGSWFNELQPACNSFVCYERITWISIEGLPITSFTRYTFAKIVSSCGELADVDEPESNILSYKSLKHGLQNSKKRTMMTDEEKENKSENIENDFELDNDNELDHVSESSCMHEYENALVYKNVSRGTNHSNKSNDPFRIYNILKRHSDKVASASSDPQFPPDVTTATSGYNDVLKHKSRGYLLDVMDELIKVGKTMGYNMEGCMKNIQAIIGSQRDYHDFHRHMIDSWDGEFVLLGDFNEVHTEHERYGTIFNLQGPNGFNNFITMTGLVDLHLEGYSYTWTHKTTSKMSKLDRFLITEGLLTMFSSLSALCLDKHLSDHRPILMREMNLDYRPTPFWLFHSWFNNKCFEMVEDSWKKLVFIEANSIISLKKKLQALNTLIKQWIKEDKLHLSSAKEFIQNHLSNLENRLTKEVVMMGLFADPTSPRLILESQFPNTLYLDQQADHEREVSYDEIKKAVWDNGINKSPGPDGFTFKFFRRFSNIIDKDVVAAVSQFFSSCIFPPGCNSSFIALIPKTQKAKVVKDFRPISLIGSVYKIIAKILANCLRNVISSLISEVQVAFVSNRQILDVPFILSELLSWCKHKKYTAMVFKVDFEKAFDSVRWDYLDDMLNKFGFGVKWRGWIQGCLNTAIGSILVNRSPTFKFEFHKGLKQRDLLSPFLSILIMESLHFSFKYVVNASLYKGIPIDDTLILNHLFYADDVMFVGKRDTSKVNTIVNVLKCFFLDSGLKIILHKSKLMGIGISHSEVVLAAESLESIRPNFFNGVANSDKRLAMIGWKKVFASKKMEGLAFQVSLLLTAHFFLNGYGASSPKAPLYGLGLLMPFMDPKALLIINISFLDALLSSISSESLKVSLLKFVVLPASLFFLSFGSAVDAQSCSMVGSGFLCP